MHILKRFIATFALLAWGAVRADVTVGVSLPLTGPASGLGIPIHNQLKLWPSTIAGEKLTVVVFDDAGDPANGVRNANRLVTERKVDVLFGSAATPVGIAMAEVALESRTPQLIAAPAQLAPGKDAWSFRLPQSNAVMARAVVRHMLKHGVRTAGFLGYADAYGEGWYEEFKRIAEESGLRLLAQERFARTDTTVTSQAIKLVGANPDAILVVASGSGAAMPHRALVERAYKGRIYQTHAAATRDLMRIGGKDVEGSYVVAGPVLVPEQLPDEHPSKKAALEFVRQYEAAYGAGSRNQFAGHAYDALLTLQKAVPLAMARAKPGTPEFRAALRDALEAMGRTVFAHGVRHWDRADHWGYGSESAVMVKVVNGDWKID